MSPLSPARIAQQRGSLLLLAMFLCVAAVNATSKKPPAHPVNINSASAGQLQQVPGIGPATAEKILQMRKSYGAFKSVDDLLAIRGIGPKRLDKMRKYLVAGRQPAAVPKGPAAGNSAVPAKCPGCERASPAKKSAAVATRPKVAVKKDFAEPAKAANRSVKPAAASEDEEPE
jgi:comEA protein